MRWCLAHQMPAEGMRAKSCLLLHHQQLEQPAVIAPAHGHLQSRKRARRCQQTRRRHSCSCQAAVLSDAATEESAATDAVPGSSAAGPAAAAATVAALAAAPHASVGPVVSPDDFTLEPGELSRVERATPCSPADVFRCPSCTERACQGPAGCQEMQWRTEQGGYLREILTARVYDVAVETPLEVARGLSEDLGCTLLLKREDLQPVFSFKLRGAYNKMASLSAEQLARGVICSSAGNHAQGVALAASHLGCTATVCMPVTTPDIKVAAVRRLGAHVELCGDTYSETQTHAQRRAREEGLVFVAPYDDPLTVAGQGTIGTEILRQLTSAQRGSLHAVFVAVGGGGLVAGIAAYVKALHPGVKVIGVEPTGANAMAMSLACGERVTLIKVDAFADGVAVKQVGAETFRLCRELVDGVLLVDNGAISAAIRDVFNETRCILEPAGAVAVAGAKAYLRRQGLQGVAAVAVTSGANMNFDRLQLVAELAAVGARQEATFATTIPERPGAFAAFVSAALSGTDTQVTELKYRYSAGSEAHILWGAGLRAPGQAAELQARLHAAGLPMLDVSAVEAAQVHLRHLVGGRARSYMGELPHERIFQVEFPERAGALARFLGVVSPAWNVSLFHYRRTGNRSTVLLVGIQVPPASDAAFVAAQAALADEYTFSELAGESRRVFDMFLS